MKRILSLITPLLIYAFFFTSTIANAQGSSVAYKFESDGIIYEIISGKDCGVVYNSLNKYTGSIVIPEFVTYNGTTYNVKWICSGAFYECTGLTSITIPESVDIIENRAFYRCINLNSISLGSKVFRIGNDAFAWCQNLTSITIPASVQSIGDNAFYQCSSLANIKISESIVTIGSDAFTGTPWYHNQEDGLIYVGKVLYEYKGTMPDNTSISLRDNITCITGLAFYGCTGLTSITIPESVTSIGSTAFYGCSNLSKVYVKKGSKALIQVWKVLPTNATAYDTDMITMLPKPYMTFDSATQSSVTYKLHNIYDDYTFSLDYDGDIVFNNGKATVKGLYPEEEIGHYLYVDNYGINSGKVMAKAASLNLGFTVQRTASSLSVNGTYTKGDAVVKSTSITLDGNTVDGNILTSSKGLKPYSSHEATYKVVIAYGEENSSEKTYTKTSTFYTSALSLVTAQPKVVSSGNVIIAATTNVDDKETNVGFEWRREDWSDTFASQTGAAVLYDGTMEGYIRNMNAEKLWKYRAYYLDNDGTYYYGDWVGIDPSNTSYFEPTVRTYANISVKGNTALVKGYALNGTDKIKVQGFKYWKTANKGNSLDIDREGDMLATAIPADAITKTVDIVGSGQQLMNATLEGLDYDATYHCVAFATTTENETFYGEEQMFTTESITGIEGVKESAAGSSNAVTVVAYYDLNGKRLSQPLKGLNIIRMSDGTTRKVVK